MPIFSYIAINGKGKEVKGSVEATDKRSAVTMVRNQSLFVVSMNDHQNVLQQGQSTQAGIKGLWMRIKSFFPVTSDDRIFFFQQLSLMIRSGLTLLRALDVCSQQTRKVALASSISRMKKAIQSGSSFSEAIAQEGKMFPPIVQKLIQSAEVSGQMDQILSQISQYLTRKHEQKRQILTSLTYPVIVVLVTVFVAGFLIMTVVPKFVQFLSRKALVLPWSTQLLVDLSHFITNYLPYMIMFFSFMLLALYCTYRTEKGHLLIDRFVLKIPVIGNLLVVSAMAQMTQTLSVLIRSGITLFESIRTTTGVMRNQAIKQCLEKASDQIIMGKELSGCFVNKVMPPLIAQVISVGEKSGTLVQVLEEISQFYDNQMKTKTKQLASLIEPVLILIIGGMVGFVYFSFFQAVFQLVGR